MKIGNNYQIRFEGTKIEDKNKQNPVIGNQNISQQKETPTAETLKAYALSNIMQSQGKGIKSASVLPDYDGNQLIYNIKAPLPNTRKVKFIYEFPSDKMPREAFSSQKDSSTGLFSINIPVLNRKTNILIPNLKINSVEYFDETNLKISEEIPENLTVNPQKIMKIMATRYTTIDGKTSVGEFDSVSEGVSYGKLVKMEYGDVIRYKGNEPIIAMLSNNDLNSLFSQLAEGTFSLPMNVKGILATFDGYKQGSNITDFLGHAVSRLRGRKIFALADKQILKDIEKNYYNNPDEPYVKIELDMDNMKVSGLKELPAVNKSKINIPNYKLVNELLSPEDDNYTVETVGLKAFNLGKLKKLQTTGGFKVPRFFVVPAGVWNYSKKSPENVNIYGEKKENAAELGEYHYYSQKADASEMPEVELKALRRLISDDMIIPKDVRTKLKEKTEKVFNLSEMVKNKGCLIARSSFNGEDSDDIATQGLYDSFPGIRTDENLFRGIKEVWASKWSDLAYMSRRNHKISHRQIQPNVIVQEVVPVDYTFTINTADPRKNNMNKMIIQLSQGVYSGYPNSPYIFEYNKLTGDITRTSLALKKRAKPIDKIVMDDFDNKSFTKSDYSNDVLNMSKEHYAPVMKKVFEVAKFIEKNFGGKPQDIEGGIIFKPNPVTGEAEPEIHIWQTRDVHLIKR